MKRAPPITPSPIAGIEPDLEYLYSAVHTALRKLCDSKITSAMWNAFHVIDADTRVWFVDIMTAAITSQEFKTDVELIKAIQHGFRADETGFGKPQRMMICCMLELFTHNDWLGMLGYVITWPEDVK